MSPRIHARLVDLEAQLLETEHDIVTETYAGGPGTPGCPYVRQRLVKQAIWWLTGVRR